MTLDGYCDHTSIVPDEEIHYHYSELLKSAGVALFGRVTYQLMEYWKGVLTNPTGDKAMDDFAVSIDRIPKVVFSHTLHDVDWETARIAKQGLREEVLSLRQQQGNDILICSRSLIAALINLGLLDEFQLTIHPVIAGKGLPLLDLISERKELKLVKIRTFASGGVTHYYNFGN